MKLRQVSNTTAWRLPFYNNWNISVESTDPIIQFGKKNDFGFIILLVLIGLAVLLLVCFASRPRNTSICFLNVVQFCYEWCCCRLDCASKLNPNEAIMRYTEEPPLDKNLFIDHVLSDEYIKSILNSFALELPEYFLSILPSGSLREGFGKILPSTSVLASDFDIMLIPDAALAGDPSQVYVGNEKPLFATVETREIEEGFLWLRLENEYMKQWKNLCIRRQTEGRGCSYLSSHKVHDMIRKTFLISDWLLLTNKKVIGSKHEGEIYLEQSGPALTVKVVTKSMKACGMKCCEKERDDIIFYCDFTFSLYCPQWPDKSSKLHFFLL